MEWKGIIVGMAASHKRDDESPACSEGRAKRKHKPKFRPDNAAPASDADLETGELEMTTPDSSPATSASTPFTLPVEQPIIRTPEPKHKPAPAGEIQAVNRKRKQAEPKRHKVAPKLPAKTSTTERKKQITKKRGNL